MTNALFASGGVREIGSLRTIRLMRGGKLVRRSISTTCRCAATRAAIRACCQAT
jgi:hypothetical protein